MKSSKKKISIKRYNKIMDKIISMGYPSNDTLIKMLDEASKYAIKLNGKKTKTK